MAQSFFSGSYEVKLDEKGRFVLPQDLRYQLVEDGELQFSIALSMGGCLAIYKRSEMDRIVEGFRKKQHVAKFQKFFTLFFSTLFHTTCDKVGRVNLPKVLKNGVGIQSKVVIAGAMNKIELWPQEEYQKNLTDLLAKTRGDNDLAALMEEAFSCEEPIETKIEEALERVQTTTL